MYSFLPDELLKEILAPALQVPDDSFACIQGRSPFSNYTQTTSAYLLVCKDWLRVATPLLYSVVVLRSRAQIQALEYALKSVPELAGFIKKLRIESGYCASLLKILKETENLTDLCLSLEIYSSDNVAGICKGFAYINPRRLILFDLDWRSNRAWNQKIQQFVTSMNEYLGKWNLTTVVLPTWSYYWHDMKVQDIIDALCSSQTLEVVSIYTRHFHSTCFDRLANIPSLKKITFRGNSGLISKSLHVSLEKNPRLKSLVCFTKDEPDHSLSSGKRAESSEDTSPALVNPRDWLTALPDTVWARILSHAMGIPQLQEYEFSEMPRHWDTCWGSSAHQILARTCRKFRDLVRPLHHQCVIITSGKDLTSLNNLVSRREDIGKQIKSFLTVDRNYYSTGAQELNEILLLAPNIQRVSTSLTCWRSPSGSFDIFDWQAFTTLAQQAGPRLVDLDIHLHRPTQPKTPDIIYKFTALRHLEFSSSAKFTFEPTEVKRDALQNLESIACTSINNTFISLLSCMDLPKVREARFPVLEKCEGAITFLRKHGQKLDLLELGFLPGISVFDICPNIKVFQVPREKPGFAVAEFFSSTNEHPLEVIEIKTSDVAKGAEKEKFKYIGELDLSNFTSLHYVSVFICRWPLTEHEIKKSHWAVWAERLKEKHGVDIVDKDGQNWIPRLRERREK